VIVAPLAALLRKNNFKWNEAAGKTFDSLKHVVTHPPALRLPEFYFILFILSLLLLNVMLVEWVLVLF
jgi:hypothetical protein